MGKHINIVCIRITSCKVCAKSIRQLGSGRAKKNCGNHKKLKRKLKTSQELKEKQMRRVQTYYAKDHAFVKAEKMRVGRCAMHPFIFDGAELLFDDRTVMAACWDHVDRSSKRFTVSQMVGRGGAYNEQNLRDEMAKCVLLCANCHQIKTYEDNDYRQIDRVIAKLNQPSLFDIDPT